MKPLFTLLATALLGVGATACGSSGDTASHATAKAATSAAGSEASTTTDEADSKGLYDGDDGPTLDFGHTADPVDRRAIAILIKRYLAAAAAGNGNAACSMLNSFVAESVTEDVGDTPALRGKTCGAVMSKLFKQQHRQLAADSASLEVITVRVEGDRALTVMHFATSREARKIPERREGGTWKILELLVTPLP